MTEFFTRAARWSADLLGSWQAFTVATIGTLLWFVSGPVFGWSDTWQLVVNTATTVLTFLAVFLIQHAQNRDAKAVQIKLDELLVKLDKPDTSIAGIEQRSAAELEEAERAVREAAEQVAGDERVRSHLSRAALNAEVTTVGENEHRPPDAPPSGDPPAKRPRWGRMTG